MQPLPIYDSISRDPIASADALSAMVRKEQTMYKTDHCDYLPTPLTLNDENCSTVITPEDRVTIVDWCYTIIDKCNFSRESVAIAMELVHRFLSKQSISASYYDYRSSATQNFLSNRRQYQLLIVTSLYISIKANERVVLGSDFFAELSRGLYTKEEIDCAERKILHCLTGNIYPPTSSQMANYILSLTYSRVDNLNESTWGLILDEVQYQAECAVRDYYLSTVRPSTIAIAAILNAVNQVPRLEQQRSFLSSVLSVLNEYVFAPFQEMLDVKSRLQRLLDDDEENGFKDYVGESSSHQDVGLKKSAEAMMLDTCSLHCVTNDVDE